MRFIPTESESRLLKSLKQAPAGKTSLENLFEDKATLERAIEGCIVKGFATEENGMFVISDSGEKYI